METFLLIIHSLACLAFFGFCLFCAFTDMSKCLEIFVPVVLIDILWNNLPSVIIFGRPGMAGAIMVIAGGIRVTVWLFE